MKSKFLLVSALIAIFLWNWDMCIFAESTTPQNAKTEFSGVSKAPASTENQVIKEGRTWRYQADVNLNMSPSTNVFVNVCFSGATEINGKQYYNCYVWKGSEDFSEDTASLIAYMREENDKIYVRYIPTAEDDALEKGIDIIPYAPMMAFYNHDIQELFNEEILLFDASLEKGDTLYSTEPTDNSDRFDVTEVSTVECFGITRKTWHLKKKNNLNETYDYYEGIGDVLGLLPLPGSSPITYEAEPWRLVEVIDEKGNPLFAPSKMTTGVENAGEEMEVVKETFYDLNGVEISKPVSNGVYVKTQTLSNGATRTEKVMVK